MKNFSLKKFLSILALTTLSAQAEVKMSYEKDSIPVLSIDVVLPVGTESVDPKYMAATSLLSDILEGGTVKFDRQEYLDRLAEFGASTKFSMGSQLSTWSVSFPIIEGKNYQGLIDLLIQNWKTPRFDTNSFDSAKRKLVAGMVSSLDSDWSVISATPRRLVNYRDLGSTPIFLDNAKAVTLDLVKEVFANSIQKQKTVWAGVIGPETYKGLARSIVSEVFSIHEIDENFKLKALDMPGVKKTPKQQQKTFIVIEKPDRTQNVSILFALRPEKLKGSEELPIRFGNHILVEGGLGSVWGEAMRTKGGFSYSISPVSRNHLGFPALGYATNPISEKTPEATKVMADLIQESYVSAKIFSEIPQTRWDANWRSFRYDRQLSRSTPSGRLGEVSQVIQGLMSPEYFHSKASNWKINRPEVQEYFENHWKHATIVMAMMGDAKNIEPLAKKYFPDFKLVKIPYKKTIEESGYKGN